MTTDNTPFADRTALITGAASGIGAGCAQWLDRQGVARLVLVDTDGPGLDALALSCPAERIVGSVADPDLWTRLEADWAETETRIDHAVVNAGVGGSGMIADLSYRAWRRVMDVNLDGAFLTLAAVLRSMRAHGGGSAVVVASSTGIKPVPGIGPYGVAKAGVAHMARIAAAENAKHKICVNAVAPGGVDTALWDGSEEFRAAVSEHGREAALAGLATTTPLGRFATTEEMAGEIGFLLSDAAANMTGHVLVSDGGYTL